MTTEKDIIEKDKIYEVRLCCADCGHQLNSIPPTTGKDIFDRWTGLVMSSGFVSGKCPNGCEPTFSDLNTNTELLIWDVEKERYLEKRDWKFWCN